MPRSGGGFQFQVASRGAQGLPAVLRTSSWTLPNDFLVFGKRILRSCSVRQRSKVALASGASYTPWSAPSPSRPAGPRGRPYRVSKTRPQLARSSISAALPSRSPQEPSNIIRRQFAGLDSRRSRITALYGWIGHKDSPTPLPDVGLLQGSYCLRKSDRATPARAEQAEETDRRKHPGCRDNCTVDPVVEVLARVGDDPRRCIRHTGPVRI